MNAAATLTVDERAILDALTCDWGAAYVIGCVNGRWRATRWDGTGEQLAGATPDNLAAALRADWSVW